MNPVRHVAVVGGGTAGFLAALSLKIKLPQLKVTVIRSPEIGIIGVGEGSTPPFTRFLHEFLGVAVQEFVRATQPGLKTGTCFHWGPRRRFYFPLGPHMALRPNNLPRAVGYYFEHGDHEAASPLSARMKANRTFAFNANKSLMVDMNYAYHVENERFAAFLENKASSAGVEIIDGTIETVSQDERGITGYRCQIREPSRQICMWIAADSVHCCWVKRWVSRAWILRPPLPAIARWWVDGNDLRVSRCFPTRSPTRWMPAGAGGSITPTGSTAAMCIARRLSAMRMQRRNCELKIRSLPTPGL